MPGLSYTRDRYLKDPIGSRSPWRKFMWLLKLNMVLMAHKQLSLKEDIVLQGGIDNSIKNVYLFMFYFRIMWFILQCKSVVAEEQGSSFIYDRLLYFMCCEMSIEFLSFHSSCNGVFGSKPNNCFLFTLPAILQSKCPLSFIHSFKCPAC